jgi:starvation-inducible DNA-binding protein
LKEVDVIDTKVRIGQLRQAPGELTENALGLEVDRARQIVQALNSDLASEYVLYHQYKKHHWLVEGAEFWQIHKLLDDHAGETLKYADMLAERITALSGVPVSGPAAQEKTAYIEHEPEGLYDLREMLENDLRSGQAIVFKLREHIDLARGLGDYGTEHLLHETLLGQEELVHQLDHLLALESLAKAVRK